jgi:glycosyltransferase involved in cell wall biosynthesis
MRIVLVNWAHLWDGASYGGGVNGYCQALALDLVRRGHEVISLCSGVTYTPGATPGSVGSPEVRRHDDWLGVRVFEVINSPVLAPSLLQFDDPAGEVSSPALETLVRTLLVTLRPDVVHFHNIEGFSAGCVDAARRPHGEWPGAKVLYSLHNYHTICPQVYLMHAHTTPCLDSLGGERCAGCIERSDTDLEKRRRAERYAAEFLKSHPSAQPKPAPPPPPPSVTRGLMTEVKRYVRGQPLTPEPPPPLPPTPIEPPGSPVLGADDILGARPGERETEVRGQARSITSKECNGFEARPADPAWRPLLNVIQPEPHAAALNEYGERRAAMVAMLNRCDRVLAVSGFVREKFVSMGLEPSRAEVLPIGTRINEVVAANHELVFEPEPFAENPRRPIRLVFLGYNNYYKGLHVLADALELLTPEYLRRLGLTVYAHQGQTSQWRFERLRPRLAEMTYQYAYDFSDIPWILGGKDLVVVPSVWWDNAPQTVFEAFGCGVPVLGAALGGIPDFVRHGHNGLLFRGNDRYDLARRLAEIVREPRTLDEVRRNVRPPKGIAHHGAEMENLYRTLLDEETGDQRVRFAAPGTAVGAQHR